MGDSRPLSSRGPSIVAQETDAREAGRKAQSGSTPTEAPHLSGWCWKRVCSAMECISYYSARDCKLKVSALMSDHVCNLGIPPLLNSALGSDTLSGAGHSHGNLRTLEVAQTRGDPSRTISTTTRLRQAETVGSKSETTAMILLRFCAGIVIKPCTQLLSS